MGKLTQKFYSVILKGLHISENSVCACCGEEMHITVQRNKDSSQKKMDLINGTIWKYHTHRRKQANVK